MQTFSVYLERRDPNLYTSLLGETIQLDEGIIDMIKGVYNKVMGKRATPDELLKKVRDNTRRYQTYWDKSKGAANVSIASPESVEADMAKQENAAMLEKIMKMTENDPEWRERNGFNTKRDIVDESGMSFFELMNTIKKGVVAGATFAFLSALLMHGGAGNIGNKHDGDIAPKMPVKSKKIDDKPDDDWKNPGFPMPEIPSANQDGGADIGGLQAKTKGFRTPIRTILKGPGDYKTPIRDRLFNR
jgi:hypothetical protein